MCFLTHSETATAELTGGEVKEVDCMCAMNSESVDTFTYLASGRKKLDCLVLTRACKRNKYKCVHLQVLEG